MYEGLFKLFYICVKRKRKRKSLTCQVVGQSFHTVPFIYENKTEHFLILNMSNHQNSYW